MKRGFIWLSILADADSKMVMTFSIADESVGESPRLPTLLDETLEKLGMPERVGTSRVVVALIGDKVYDARKNFFALRQARHRVADPPQGQRQLPRRRNRQGAHRGCLGPAALCLSRGSHHVEHRCGKFRRKMLCRTKK